MCYLIFTWFAVIRQTFVRLLNSVWINFCYYSKRSAGWKTYIFERRGHFNPIRQCTWFSVLAHNLGMVNDDCIYDYMVIQLDHLKDQTHRVSRLLAFYDVLSMWEFTDSTFKAPRMHHHVMVLMMLMGAHHVMWRMIFMQLMQSHHRCGMRML